MMMKRNCSENMTTKENKKNITLMKMGKTVKKKIWQQRKNRKG